MADDYWKWYANAFGPLGSAQQGPAPGPAALSPQEWDAFYRSVGIAPQAPTTRVVQSVPVNLPPLPRQTPERTSHVTSYSGLSRGSSTPEDYRYNVGMGISPTVPVERMYAGIYPNEPGPYRIGGNAPNRPTTVPQTGIERSQVAQIGVGLGNEVNAEGKRVTVPNPLQIVVDGANPIQTAVRVAPTPFPPYRAVGSQVDSMPPMPISRPNRSQNGLPETAPSGTIMLGADGKHYQFGANGQWMTATMSPLPMATARRPGAPVAPVPVSRPAGLAIGAMPQGNGPLRITVAGANPVARPRPTANIPAAVRAVSQSGDYSSGNQLEMASLLASGNSWREAQARKK